jgi:hypothetical protein
MLTLISSDVGDSGKYICTMSCTSFDAVPVIYAALSCLVINVEILKIVVKVDRASTEVAAEKSSVCGEHGGDINVPLSAKRDSNTRLPLVKVSYNSDG